MGHAILERVLLFGTRSADYMGQIQSNRLVTPWTCR